MKPDVRICAGVDELSLRAAEATVRTVNEAAGGGSRCSLVLSGGSTPRTLYGLLASQFAKDIPWAQLHIFWGDERYVPLVDPASNYRMAKEALLDHVPCPPANIHPMPTHFPSPDAAARDWDLACLSPATYRAIGFSGQKARALRTLALAVERREIDLERLTSVDDTEASAQLRQLRGVGRWTAEYVLIRGLGRLQVFPGDDVGGQKSLARWLGRSLPLDYAGVQRAVQPWRPYAGLVYFHLLLEGLFRSGELELAS